MHSTATAAEPDLTRPDQIVGGTTRTPTPPPRSQARLTELDAVAWLQELGFYAVDHPKNTPTFSIIGRGVEPDLGARLGIAGPVFDLPDGPIDTIGEVKLQRTRGTASEKLTGAIERYARLSDIHGLPAVIFHDLVGGMEDDEIEEHARYARARGVGFVAIGSMSAPELRTYVSNLSKRRRLMLGNREHLRDLVATYGMETLTAAVRQGAEDQAANARAPHPAPNLAMLLF